MGVARIAAVVAIAMQAVFLADYYRLTDGCFCAITGTGVRYGQAFAGEIAFLRVASAPAALVASVLPTTIDEPWQTLILSVLAGVVWYVVLAACVGLIRCGVTRWRPFGTPPSGSSAPAG